MSKKPTLEDWQAAVAEGTTQYSYEAWAAERKQAADRAEEATAPQRSYRVGITCLIPAKAEITLKARSPDGAGLAAMQLAKLSPGRLQWKYHETIYNGPSEVDIDSIAEDK